MKRRWSRGVQSRPQRWPHRTAYAVSELASAHEEKELEPVRENTSGLVSSEASLIKSDEECNDIQVFIVYVTALLQIAAGVGNSAQTLMALTGESLLGNLFKVDLVETEGLRGGRIRVLQ
jgi:hypothetical protein